MKDIRTIVLSVPEVQPLWTLSAATGRALVTIRPDGSVILHEPVNAASKAFWDQIQIDGVSLINRLTVAEAERDGFREVSAVLLETCRQLTKDISALKDAADKPCKGCGL